MNHREIFEKAEETVRRKEQLLAETEDLIRTMPSNEEFKTRSDDVFGWVGRAAAVLTRWDSPRFPQIDGAVSDVYALMDMEGNIRGRSKLRSLLHQARADLRLDVGPVSTVINTGQVFDYFDEIRKAIAPARADLLFVDPYLDAEFVTRYLPHVVAGTTVRLLGSDKKMATLLPAVDMFAQQSGLPIQVRTSTNIHDRYVFVDRAACYLSGASFKDGAKKAPVVLTQIGDAFQAMLTTYENLWASAKPER